jgi:DHA1 family bicyclomycin/chloramphenicol resistance-like MFS transporter
MPKALPRAEFIALIAMMFAGIALSTDAMLPVFPQMAKDLTPNDLNAIQLVVTVFLLGIGIGTIFTGPLSDSYGRKPVIFGGVVLFVGGASLSVFAQSLEVLLIARFLQGLGASGPRVVAMAVVRDLYSGRQMARIVSFVMILFTLVPAAAPLVGQEIARYFGWRGIFVLFVLYATTYTIWMLLRLPETLKLENRRSFRFPQILAGLSEILRKRTVLLAIAAQGMCLGMIFLVVSLTQQIFDVTFDRADSFPLWFGAVALLAASSGFLNAVLVTRVSLVRIIRGILTAQIVFSLIFTIVWQQNLPLDIMFFIFIAWKTTIFFQAGLTMGNLNAIAMEPLGHIAGIGASVIGSSATILAVMVVIPIGLTFDGTPMPLCLGTLGMAVTALFLMTRSGFESDKKVMPRTQS